MLTVKNCATDHEGKLIALQTNKVGIWLKRLKTGVVSLTVLGAHKN